MHGAVYVVRVTSLVSLLAQVTCLCNVMWCCDMTFCVTLQWCVLPYGVSVVFDDVIVRILF